MRIPSHLAKTELRGTGGDYVYIDTSCAPMAIMEWYGRPTEKIAHEYYTWRIALSKFLFTRGTKLIVVKGFDNCEPPKPTTRRLVGNYQAADKAEPGFAGQILVVSKPILRGALTAVTWLSTERDTIKWAKTLEEGIRLAIEDFKAIDLEPPDVDPATWEWPSAKR